MKFALPLSTVLSASLLSAACVSSEKARVVDGSSMPVVGVHDLELAEGVTPEQFEAFVAGPFADFWSTPRGGFSVGVGKCDRGESLGQYQLAFFFDSMAVRDSYFPTADGAPTELWEREMEPVVGETMDALFALCTSTGFTDYVVLSATEPEDPTVPPTFGTHRLELREGVTSDDMVAFARGAHAEAWAKPIAGCGQVIMVGERGEHTGEFRIVYSFRPYTLRDRYIPEGGFSEEFVNDVQPLLPVETRAEFDSLCRSVGFSDWAPVLP
jgi:hypothetical protein